jgi:hypothetical protein
VHPTESEGRLLPRLKINPRTTRRRPSLLSESSPSRPKSTSIAGTRRCRWPIASRSRGAEIQFRCGIAVQRPMRHHHDPATQQRMDLGQRQPVFEPPLDLFMLGPDRLPGLTPAGRTPRAHPGDHRRNQPVSELTISNVAIQPARPCPVDAATQVSAIDMRTGPPPATAAASPQSRSPTPAGSSPGRYSGPATGRSPRHAAVVPQLVKRQPGGLINGEPVVPHSWQNEPEVVPFTRRPTTSRRDQRPRSSH